MSEDGADDQAAYFQVFLAKAGHLQWRLLSGNNRELGRGVSDHDAFEDCVLGIKHLLADIDTLTVRYFRTPANRWTWQLASEGPVAVSGVSFDRRVRCVEAAQRFLALAAGAGVRHSRPLRLMGLGS